MVVREYVGDQRDDAAWCELIMIAHCNISNVDGH